MSETEDITEHNEETTLLIHTVNDLDSEHPVEEEIENGESFSVLNKYETVEAGEEEEEGCIDGVSEESINYQTTTFTAITLLDGTQAYVAHNLPFEEDELEEHTLQLDDGNTLVIKEIPIDGQTIRLKDGTTAFLSTAADEEEECLFIEDSFQTVQLNDSFTTCIAVTPNTVLEPLELDTYSEVLTQETEQQIELDETEQSETKHSDLLELQEEQSQPESELHVAKDHQTGGGSSSSGSTTTKSFMCPHLGCGKYYTTYHHLKVHERAHTGDRPFRCTESGCNKAFATCYGRKTHIRTHTGEKPYNCPEESCKKSFKTSGDLQKHIRTHTGERPFRCPYAGCGRSFTTSNIRKVHVRTHTGERPYVCTEEGCERTFASATNYKNHLRIHSGEKPYACKIQGCEKRFTEYSSLYKHHMVHTQQKPYSCPICFRHYRQASTLTVHKRTAHGIIEAEDGSEVVLGEAVFTLTNNSASKIQTLNSNLLGFSKDGATLLALETSSNNSDDSETGHSQYLVVDPSHLAALEQFGAAADSSEVEELEMEDPTEIISE